MKVAIIGAGHVGSTLAFALLVKGACDALSIVDIDAGKASGEAEDLRHGLSFASNMDIRAQGFEGVADADVVVLAAGRGRRDGESRLDLTRSNVGILEAILEAMAPHYRGAILLVASNPVDILTHVAWKRMGIPASRVIGTGTALDTARFRDLLGREFDIDPRSIHASVVGEHGDSCVPVWSMAAVGQIPLTRFAPPGRPPLGPEDFRRIQEAMLDAGRDVIRLKGATYYGIALSMSRILEAILGHERSVFTLSSPLEGFMELPDVSLSLPVVLGREGIRERLPIHLDVEEMTRLRRSAEVLLETLRAIGYA